MANNDSGLLDASFGALAHPARRHIVEALTSGPRTVGQATRGLGVAKPTVTRHLHVLEASRLISRTVHGREHRLALVREQLALPAGWLERQSLWERQFDTVEDYLIEEHDRG